MIGRILLDDQAVGTLPEQPNYSRESAVLPLTRLALNGI